MYGSVRLECEGKAPVWSNSLATRSNIALIVGIAGQDGYFLSRFLAEGENRVIGVLLPTDVTGPTVPFLSHPRIDLLESSICDEFFLRRTISKNKPGLVFNLSGISFIPYSWDNPCAVEKVNGFAVGKLLQIIKEESPESRFFQACSSEMFGHFPVESPQSEQTRFNPDNPYGSSKVFAYHLTKNYRERYGIFACSGILYNHESEWRPPTFVTRKITQAAAAIKLGKQERLELGALDTVRDWSYAGDIVEAMWLMLNANKPDDYVLASGKLHSVSDILDIAFEHVGFDWHDYVKINISFKRPSEGLPLCGDSSKARKELGWSPKMGFESMIRTMVDKDLERLKD